MSISITKQYSFAAAHFLPEHEGKCRNMHGHNYRVEVEVTSTTLAGEGSSHGMVLDFSDLDRIVDPVIGQLDHHVLNDIFSDVGYDYPPTAERLAVWLAMVLQPAEEDVKQRRVRIVRVRVWETDKAYAEWTA